MLVFGSVTIRPHEAIAIEAISTPNPARRISLYSPATTATIVSLVCAAALHLAFPRTGAWWLIPFALAGLFAVWSRLSPRAAALNGYLAGVVFFGLTFSWFGETAGRLLGSFGFIIDVGPAVVEALAFAVAGLITAVASRRCSTRISPAVAAAGFTLAEWARSSGTFGVPFGQLQLALVESPLRSLAAFTGGYGLTFAAALLGAYLAAAILAPRRWRALAVVVLGIVCVASATWILWPARQLATPTISVAAVQGNIRQEIKASDTARLEALVRYPEMTRALTSAHPVLVVWPETVILTDMRADASTQRYLGSLAEQMHTTLAVGTIVRDPATDAVGNAVVYFAPDGRLRTTVTKRQLVPFAEWLPGPAWLRALPLTNEIATFTPGAGAQLDAALGVGTLICWESVFPTIAHDEITAGARFFAVATDDAWFGHTDGPYQHAQATTLRAVETGRWIVRAAATGFSGIVAPDGTWTERSGLETQESVVGRIGAPVDTVFDRVGPILPIVFLGLIVGLGLIPRRRAR